MTEPEKWAELIVSVGELSDPMVTWTISLFAGSVLLITSTSYNKPEKRIHKLFYLMFFPAWIFAFLSINSANQIKQRIPASNLLKGNIENNSALMDSFIEATTNYGDQFQYFLLSLLFLAIWLASYLIWWIFSNSKKQN